jgi:hypothetical protein
MDRAMALSLQEAQVCDFVYNLNICPDSILVGPQLSYFDTRCLNLS